MKKVKVNNFEKHIIYKTFVYFFISLFVLFIFLIMQMTLTDFNVVKNLKFNSWTLSIMWGLFLCVLIISAGLIWIFTIVRKDKNSMFKTLGNQVKKPKFIEFEELNAIYNAKIDEILDLKNQLNEKKTSITSTELLTKNAFYKYRTALETSGDLDNKLLDLKDFYDKLSEKLSSMIWITDYYGNVLYTNDLVMENFEENQSEIKTIYDILEITQIQFELFRKRNFNNILLYLKNQKSVTGKNLRIFDDDSIKYILFISETSNQEKVMNRSYLKKSRDLHFINEISKIISGQISVDTTLQDAIEKIAFLGNYNSCSIRLINDKSELVLKALSGYSSDFVLSEKVMTTNSHIGYAFNENKILTINSVEDLIFEDPAVKNLILNNRKIAYIPLTNYSKTLGVMSILGDYDFDSESLILLESISINVTIALEKILLYEKLKSNYFKTVEAFVTATEIKSERFNGHSRRVAQICRIVAEKLYLNTQEVDEIYMAGLLHDVGKLGFSDNSLDYYFDTDKHGGIGRKMVERVGLTKDILEGIEHHHLDFDLKNGINSNVTEQPYYAQIIRIANDFDLYMNYETTNVDNPSFITDMKNLIGSVYSPQFMRIIADILLNERNLLLKIYQNEV